MARKHGFWRRIPSGFPVAALSEGGGAWSPTDLGSDLIAWWSADRADLMTLDTTAVGSWRDIVAGYDLTEATNRPAYSATSWNGLPGVTFDGSNDRLEMSLPEAFPTGDDPCEIWLLASQDHESSTGGNKYFVSYGGSSSTVAQRGIRREVQSSDNVATAFVGNGSSALTDVISSPVYYGRHLVRAQIGATETLISLDGSEGASPASIVPATGTDLFRLGATASGSAGGFASGVFRDVIITHPLDSEQAASLQTYLLGTGLLELWVG